MTDNIDNKKIENDMSDNTGNKTGKNTDWKIVVVND